MGLLNKMVEFIKEDMQPVQADGSKGMSLWGNWGSYSDGSPSNQFNDTRSYMGASQKVTWVSVCCDDIAKPISNAGYGIYDDNNKPTKNKDLIELFNRPNPFQSFSEMKEILMWQLLLAGNAYIWKTKANAYDYSTLGGKYSQIWLVNPMYIEPICDSKEYISGYRIRNESGEKTIPAEDIVHIKLPNPMNERIGVGKIQANAMLYNIDYASQYFNWKFFNKGGRPASALEVPTPMNADAVKDLEQQFSRYQGVENAHKFIVLQNGMKVADIGTNQKDMDYIEQRKMTQSEIQRIFGVPMWDYSNLAGMREQRNIFLQDTITPYLNKLDVAITRGIVRDFEKKQTFEHDCVVPKDRELAVRLTKEAITSGVLTPNEARVEYLEMEIVEGEPAMDEHYMPFNMMPISESRATTEPITDKIMPVNSIKAGAKVTKQVQQQLYRIAVIARKRIGKTIRKEMISFFDGQEKRVLSALDAEKAMKVITADDIFNAKKEKAELVKAIKKGHTAVVMTAIQEANDILGTDVDSSTANPQVTARVGELGKDITVINVTTKHKISEAIKAGIEAGEGVPEMKKRVEEVYKGAKGYRAEMIARTESARAYDKGAILSYKDAGVKYVDVIGCDPTCGHTDCNATHIPMSEADGLEFHPNHTGAIVPVVST